VSFQPVRGMWLAPQRLGDLLAWAGEFALGRSPLLFWQCLYVDLLHWHFLSHDGRAQSIFSLTERARHRLGSRNMFRPEQGSWPFSKGPWSGRMYFPFPATPGAIKSRWELSPRSGGHSCNASANGARYLSPGQRPG